MPRPREGLVSGSELDNDPRTGSKYLAISAHKGSLHLWDGREEKFEVNNSC